MPRFTVDQKVLQNILNYLADRPFKETAALITAVQQDAKQDPNSPAEEPAAEVEEQAQA